jgi:hypothetical protein
VPVGTLCGYALQGHAMDNLLNLELIGLDTEQAKRWTYADRYLPHSVFAKPNGDAISVQLHKCFTHVTRGW